MCLFATMTGWSMATMGDDDPQQQRNTYAESMREQMTKTHTTTWRNADCTASSNHRYTKSVPRVFRHVVLLYCTSASTIGIILYVYHYQCVCGSHPGTSATHSMLCAVSTCFGHFFVVSCHCHVRQEPAAAGHRDEHSGRRSSSNNGGQCGQCVLPTVRRSLIVHLFRRLHSESLKHTSNGDTHRYTAAYDM